ncbi:MAG TPA: histidine kinase dimerization/phosphoacceptor domain-containing protein [Solirubrobacteraceae bacterium]|nr:histidine kinase dimerization/phosphoacceptor domain-containing protein [Solirubrobacteraceae bacterium]
MSEVGADRVGQGKGEVEVSVDPIALSTSTSRRSTMATSIRPDRRSARAALGEGSLTGRTVAPVLAPAEMIPARTAERTRIACEMHDVLAHRLSLLAVQAGALEFHPDAEPSEIAHAAGVIRASAHAALG